MDDLGDYVYIFLIVGAAIFEFVKKLLKKRAGNDDDYSEPIESTEPIQPTVQPMPQHNAQSATQPHVEMQTVLERANMMNETRSASKAEAHNSTKTVVASEQPQVSPSAYDEVIDFENNEQVRRAIVASEILARKF